MDNFGSGRVENIAHIEERDRFEILNQDIREPIGLPEVDVIFHLASRASPSDFTEFPVRIALTNTQGTRNVLEHATGCGAKVVYASTSEIYGDPEIHPQPETYNGSVNIRGPRGCYDESKRFGETLTVAYRERIGIDVRTARIFNTYGPRMRPDDGRVIPNFLTQAIANEPITVYGDGSQTRSFCYVDHLINGLMTLLESDDMAGDVVNLENDDEISIDDLAALVQDELDSESQITYQELPTDDPVRRRPDLSKARKQLDWSPDVPLHEGLRTTADYFRQHR